MIETRIVLLETSLPPGLSASGVCWRMVPHGDVLAAAADLALVRADCSLSEQALDHLALPLVVHMVGTPASHVLDRAIGWLMPGDDGDVLDRLVADYRSRGSRGVAESSITAQHIATLSVEARRIAEALEELARTTDADPGVVVSPAMVRRLIRLRRDRERHFPAEIFADPAWDMLLDLTAARMEGIDVPVSSLCIAAAVPTTTALRWIRTLSEAGMLQRSTDPVDARRSFVTLSDTAQMAMQTWIRRFATVFTLR
jgi:hypothetical protein